MARRPPGTDRERWRQERARFWARRNQVLNVLMILAIAAVLIRYFLLG